MKTYIFIFSKTDKSPPFSIRVSFGEKSTSCYLITQNKRVKISIQDVIDTCNNNSITAVSVNDIITETARTYVEFHNEVEIRKSKPRRSAYSVRTGSGKNSNDTGANTQVLSLLLNELRKNRPAEPVPTLQAEESKIVVESDIIEKILKGEKQ